MSGIVKYVVKAARSYFSEEDLWNAIMEGLYRMWYSNQTLQYCSWATPYNGQKLSLAIVEPRKHPHLKTVLYNVAKFYACSDVSLYIFHGTDNETFVLDIVAEWPNVHLMNLGLKNLRPLQEYSELLCSERFYKWFKSEHVLIFQTDTLVRRPIDDSWFQYDYVGAPCLDKKTLNGGLSLRRVPWARKILASDTWTPNMAEDIWWSNMARKYHATVPDQTLAADFSVEAIVGATENPVGLHQVYQYQNVATILRLTKCLMPTVVASLTTLPKRLAHLRPTLDSLRPQVSWIELNLPKVCKRTSETYEVPQWLRDYPNVKIYETEDYGPITKIWPTIVRYGLTPSSEKTVPEEVPDFFFVVDDDRIYEQEKIAELLAQWEPRRIVAGSGASFDALDHPIWKRLRPVEGHCDVVEGFAGYLFQGKPFWLDLSMDMILEHEDLFRCDDVIISNWFVANGHHLWSIKLNKMKRAGSDHDALSRLDSYVERIRRVVRLLKQQGLWALTVGDPFETTDGSTPPAN